MNTKRFLRFKMMQKYFKQLKTGKTNSTLRRLLHIYNNIHPWLVPGHSFVIDEVHDITRSYTFDTRRCKVVEINKLIPFKKLSEKEKEDMITCYGDEPETKKGYYYRLFFYVY